MNVRTIYIYMKEMEKLTRHIQSFSLSFGSRQFSESVICSHRGTAHIYME